MQVTFDRKGKCPVCSKEFLADECPHSYFQAVNHIEKLEENKHKMRNQRTFLNSPEFRDKVLEIMRENVQTDYFG